jgi:PKD repeat protein
MKKFIPLIILTVLFFNRCTYEPFADFSAGPNPAEPYEVIFFSNFSTNATSYFWDFGDGYTSTEFEPEHYYDAEGTYSVTLTAKHHNGGSDVAHLTVDVYYTQLEVTVAEWNSNEIIDYIVPDAEVTLYATYDNWYNRHNPIETRITNSQGIAFFPHVEPTIYYIDVYNANYDNDLLGQEDVSYIETVPLNKAVINSFTAWVDYYPPASEPRRKDIRVPYKLRSEKRTIKKAEISN